MELKKGHYYLIISNHRRNGQQIVGRFVVRSGRYPHAVAFSTFEHESLWWTSEAYVIKEIPEHEAILEALG